MKLIKTKKVKEMTDTYKLRYMTYKPGYIDIICLVILLVIFFVALFLTQGIWRIVDLLLLAGTGAVLGKTIGEMKTA